MNFGNYSRTKEEAEELFDFWNSLDLVRHKRNSIIYKRSIENLVKCELTNENIKTSMMNYKEIIKSDFFIVI